MKKLVKFKIKNPIVNLILMALIPPAVLCCVEFYTHVPTDLSVPVFLTNLLFYYLVFAMLSFLSGKVSAGYFAGTLLFGIVGLVNFCVVDFRSAPIVPWDIYSVGTAASVAGNYSLDITPRLIYVLLGFAALALISTHLGMRMKKRTLRAAGLLIFLVLTGVYVKGIGTDPVIKLVGFDTTLFTPNVLYRNNGLMGGFLGNMRYLKVEKPEGYSQKMISKEASAYETESVDTGKKQPNIIVLMDEAFSDLSVFGDFNTDTECLPFISSLKENTIKGQCYVSVKGGNTANTEYEFLTGDSMAFMPAGSVPYQQYLKKEMPSIASRLKELGYETIALHPFNASGWCRDTVYPLLGFDRMVFRNEFSSDYMIRDFVSDQTAFSKIIELYEEKDPDTPMFAFEVTMQNHGGYSKEKGGYVADVHLTDVTNKTTKVKAAETYLSLMNDTDKAFEEIVEYFKNQEEDTIILLFGDHQPSDYITDTFLKLQGLDRDTSEEVYYKNYCVPYVMWANFDIGTASEEQLVTSPIYLGGMLLEKAGISLTGYQQFLKELQKKYPVITSRMVMDAEQNFMHFQDVSDPLIEEYNGFVYNHLCDKKKPENFYN